MAILSFLVGISAGFAVAYTLLKSLGYSQNHQEAKQEVNIARQEEVRTTVNESSTAYDKYVRYEDRYVADQLARKVRVLCLVMMTQRSDLTKNDTKAKHIKATWGKRCNELVFLGTKKDNSLPSVKVPFLEPQSSLWAKMKEVIRYVYEHHRSQADWFLKADDNTYIIVENLRFMLADFDPREAIYFGRKYAQDYVGGAGFVLSKAALDMLVKKGFSENKSSFTNISYGKLDHCRSIEDGVEFSENALDSEIGMCLDNIGVRAADSRDSLKRDRFIPALRRSYFFSGPMETNCCSHYAVSFQNMQMEEMYVMDYLIYDLKPYGIKHLYRNSRQLPKILRGKKAVNIIKKM